MDTRYINYEFILYCVILLGLACSYLHTSSCPCAAYPADEAAEQKLVEYTEAYRNLANELVESGRYDTTDDFTVVIQPFFKDFNPPRLNNGKVDLSFFAPDCFHFSAKSHGNIKILLSFI